MSRIGKALQLGVFGCVLLLCSSYATAQDVRFNYLRGTDFLKYKTYRWVQVPGVQYPNQILDSQIKQAIDAQLATKGLSKTDAESADLYVMYQVAVDQEKQWNAYSTGGSYWGWGGWGGWGGMQTTTATSSTITIGTLDLDIYDVANKKHVWRGEASKTIKPQKNPEKLQKNLNKAMAKLLKNYPPPVK